MSIDRLPIGQRLRHLPGGTINYLLDAVDRLDRQLGHLTGSADNVPLGEVHVITAIGRNTTDVDLYERAPVGIKEATFTPPDITNDTTGARAENTILTGPVLNLETPDEATHAGKWGITRDPLTAADGSHDTGSVCLAGLVWARVDMTDAAHTCATIQTGDTKFLKSSTSGAPIIYRKLQDLDGDDTLGKQWALILLGAGTGGGGGGGPSGHDGFIVLIDFDIDPITEADPADLLEETEIDLTEEEVDAGYTVIFQDPIPTDDTDYDTNHVDNLNLWVVKPTKLTAKYFSSGGVLSSGTATDGDATSITLAADASKVDAVFDECTIEILAGTGNGQTRTIGDYDGDTQVATVDVDWVTAPDATSVYEITSTDDLKLVTTIIDDSTDLLNSGTAQAGSTSTTIKLATGASAVDDTYNGKKVRVTGGTGSGEIATITDYVGSTRVATVASWSIATPDNTSTYEVLNALRKIVRYSTKEIWFLDGKGFTRDEYKKDDYPDYPENDTFPPTGDQTFEEVAAGFLKKRYRAEATYAAGRYWLDMRTCKELPPPPLTEVSE